MKNVSGVLFCLTALCISFILQPAFSAVEIDNVNGPACATAAIPLNPEGKYIPVREHENVTERQEEKAQAPGAGLSLKNRLIVSEVLYHGSSPEDDTEWLEVYNYGSWEFYLPGEFYLVESDNDGSATAFELLPEDSWFSSWEYKVLSNAGDSNYEFSLNNDADWIGIGHLSPGCSGESVEDYDYWICGVYWGNPANPEAPDGFLEVPSGCVEGESVFTCSFEMPFEYIKGSPTLGESNDCNLASGGEWRFDACEGETVYDYSGNDNHGFLEGDSGWSDGFQGCGLSLDGDGDWVEIPSDDTLNFNGAMTIEAVVLPTGWIGDQISAASKGGQVGGEFSVWNLFAMDHGGGPSFCFGEDEGFVKSPFMLQTGRRYHLAATYDGSAVVLYVDGVETDRNEEAVVVENSYWPLYIGSGFWYDSPTGFFQGMIDEVKLHDKALSPAQIADNALATAGSWRFEETGPIAFDATDNRNNGILVGNPLRVDGLFGKALNFNGSLEPSYIQIAHNDSMNFKGEMTVEAWIRPGELLSHHVSIAAKGGKLRDEFPVWTLTAKDHGGGPSFCFEEDIGLVKAQEPLTINEWHHLVATYDGNATVLYVDGVETDRNECNEAAESSSWPLYIGSGFWFDSPAAFFNGIIDEVNLYHYALNSQQTAARSKALHSWLRLDEGSGISAGDYSINGSSGALFGDPQWVDGVLKDALLFNPAPLPDYIEVLDSNDLDFHGEMTVEAWVFPLDWPGDQVSVAAKGGRVDGEFSSWNLFAMDHGGGPSFCFGETDGLVKASFVLSTGQWHHLAAVHDGNSTILYVDGIEADRNESAVNVENSSWPMYVGCGFWNDAPSCFFHGKIDDFKYYKSALDPDQVEKHADLLAASWKLEETSGNTAHDGSGNGYNGLLNGYPQWSSYGLRFFGIDDKIAVNDGYHLDFLGEMTVMACILPVSWNAASASIMTKGTNPDSPNGIFEFPVWSLTARNPNDDGPLFTFWEDGGTVAGKPLLIGQKYHLAGVYDGTENRLYVNGDLMDRNTFIDEVYQSSQPVWIGCGYYDTTPVDFFNGHISNVRLFNRALPADEIRQYKIAHPVINEVLYDEKNNDSGFEWIELYNPGDTPIDISGFRIQSAGPFFSTDAVLPRGSIIQPCGYYLIGDPL